MMALLNPDPATSGSAVKGQILWCSVCMFISPMMMLDEHYLCMISTNV